MGKGEPPNIGLPVGSGETARGVCGAHIVKDGRWGKKETRADEPRGQEGGG